MSKIKQQYKIVDLPHTDFSCFQLLKPPFRGLVYAYNRVKFRKIEDTDGEEVSAICQFDYDIIDNSVKITKEQMAVPEFKNLLGDILMDYLEEALGDGVELTEIKPEKK